MFDMELLRELAKSYTLGLLLVAWVLYREVRRLRSQNEELYEKLIHYLELRIAEINRPGNSEHP